MITNFQQGSSEIRFETFTEAIRFANAKREESRAAMGENKRGYSSWAGPDWYGSNSFDHCIELASSGWREGRRKIEATKVLLDKALSSIHDTRQQVYFDVVGTGGFDIGEALTGVPECALEWEDTHIMERRQSNSGKIIKFLVNATVSASINARVIETRGAVIGAMIDCLEHEGYSVEIETSFTCSNRNGSGKDGWFDIRVPIKKAGEFMQADQLAFALVSPSWLRRIGFSHCVQCGEHGRYAAGEQPGGTGNGGYGSPREIEPDVLTAEQVDLYFPMAHGYDSQWDSPEAAMPWIKTQLALFGIDLELPGNKEKIK